MSAAGEHREHTGWGLFLVMLGVVQLVPSMPSGSWLIGSGLILLGVSVQRLRRGAHSGWFTVELGVLALAGGAAEIGGISAPLLPILLILIGARVMLLDRRSEPDAHAREVRAEQPRRRGTPSASLRERPRAESP